MAAKNYGGVVKRDRNGKAIYCIDFRYTNAHGERERYQRDASVQNHTAAHAEAKRLMDLAAKTGSPVAPTAATSDMLTLSEFVAGDFERDFMSRYRPATVTRYRAMLRQTTTPEYGSRPLDSFTSNDYRIYAAKLTRQGVQTKGPLNFLRTILRAAEVSGLIVVAPAMPRGLIKQSKKLPAAPSPAEVTKLLNADGWIVTAIYLAALAGLRAGEVRALEVQDVDFVHNQINVRRACSGDASDAESLTPKSGNERTVPLDVELAKHLKVVTKNRLPKARVVVNSVGETPTRQSVLTTFQAACGKLDVKRWSFHSLRHYFCTTLIRRGVGLEAVRVLAGHSNLAVTQRYAHATGDDLRDAILKLHG